MIDFYTYGTINGKAVAISLALLKVEYKTHLIDLTRGEQHHPDFLEINPSGRIPVIVDNIKDKPLVISQTGAILMYLAEKTDQLLPSDIYQKVKSIQWMQFVLTDIGTNVFNNFHLKALVSPKQPEAGEMLKQRAIKFCHEINQQLADNMYIAGEELSLADVVAFPVVDILQDSLLQGQCLNLMRWHQILSKQKAFIKGMNLTA